VTTIQQQFCTKEGEHHSMKLREYGRTVAVSQAATDVPEILHTIEPNI
jgi:hypothetical protein